MTAAERSTPQILNAIEEWSGEGVLSILGSTGTGKTQKALDWVDRNFLNKKLSDKKFPLLVSVDAVAVWQGFDIGSAKPRGRERSDYDWVGLDFVDPRENVSVAKFVEHLRPLIFEAHRQKRPIVCVGGSHFYERALLIGQSPGESSDPEFQLSLRNFSNEVLLKRLSDCDPRFAQKLHVNDHYRLTRFLDLAERQGLSYEALFGDAKVNGLQSLLPCARFIQGQNFSVEELSRRLRSRLKQMMDAGWVHEIRSLLAAGIAPESAAFQSVGYREILEFVQGTLSYDEAFEKALVAHLQLAKKQRTWIRGLLQKTSSEI